MTELLHAQGRDSRHASIFVKTASIPQFLRQCLAILLAGATLFTGMPARAAAAPHAREEVVVAKLPAAELPSSTEDYETATNDTGRATIKPAAKRAKLRSNGLPVAEGRSSSYAARPQSFVQTSAALPVAPVVQIPAQPVELALASAATPISAESHASTRALPTAPAQPASLQTAGAALCPSGVTSNSTLSPVADRVPAESSKPLQLASLLNPSRSLFSDSALMMQSGSSGLSNTLAVSVGYADNLRPNPNFPVPWQGSPNVIFIGGGVFDAGAIRLDNLSNAALTIDKVTVDLGRPGPFFDIWQHGITIPPQNSLILTQDSGENFDTSDFPIVDCGQPLSPNETRIPKVSITIAGVTTDFLDTGHILDTGGFDLACRGNESLQWRAIGTTGIGNASATITLTPATSIQAAGVAYTATALVSDAGNQPLSNVVVNFNILSGPNTGKTGTGTTDAHGNATFTYTSALPGTDILQASVTNAAGGVIQSEQVTNTWISSGPCPPQSQPLPPSTSLLTYAGQNTGEFNDPLVLAAQLADGSGNPLNGRALSFAFAGKTFQTTTNGNGVATVNIASAPAPGSVPLAISFAGDGSFNPAQVNTSVNIGREETTIRYLGKTLLGTAVPQQVMALLTDSLDGSPIANETVTFTIGSITQQAVTNSNGIATRTITLGPDQASGPAALQVSFAGDSSYKPSFVGVPILVFLSTSFVVWGGNQGGLKLGQDVNFWGHSWANQVTSGNYNANPSFKGFADPVNQIHVCEASAGTGGPLDDQCWQSKPGQSFPPPLTLPAFIEVIISTAIAKQGSEIFGNIASAAVCQVDPIPAYGPDPGKPGFCKLVAVIEDGANVFPPRPDLLAVQDQPPTVLPGQTFTVNAIVTNNSNATANSVIVNESFDGVTPPTGSQSFSSLSSGQHQTASFQVTAPVIPIRQSNESSVAYEQRLAGIDGRLFTSTGLINFTDSANEPFLPLPVSSFSRLQLPQLTLGVSGPSCVGPGSGIPYKVTITNIGSADAKNTTLLLQLPNGTTATVQIASIPVGTSVTETINFVVPAIAPKQPNESDQQYIARLQSIDGEQLMAVARVNWEDAIGNNYGTIEQPFISITERVPVVTTTPQGPTTLLPGQTANLNFTTQNIGGGNASQVLLQITNPNLSVFNVPAFPLQSGQATVASSAFTVPTIAAKQSGETDAAYLARLSALDNSSLNFTTQLNWLDASGNNYGPTHTGFVSTEILPVLGIMLAGPSTATAGDKITYTITLTNNGHATATIGTLTIDLPDGTTHSATPAQSTLAAGASTTASVTFTIPTAQAAGTITATAHVTWTDGNSNSYGPLSSAANTQVAGIPPAVLASCLPTSSLSVLLQGNNVSSYVPNGSWGNGAQGIRFVPVEGADAPTAAISTPAAVNSCSSNSVTGQTVCTANNTDVYLLRAGTLTNTLKSGSNGVASFSGGSCQNCGVAINAVTNQAVIAMGLSGGSGVQFLDLNTNTFASPILATGNVISEDISVDPGRNLVLSPGENSEYGLFKTDNSGTKFFQNRISPGGEFDSSAEDCTTGIALATMEFTSSLFITDLSQANFTSGSPGTWTAPGAVQNFPDFSLSAGTSGIAIAPGSHLGIVTGEFGGNGIGVIQLPATAGSGTPAALDWVAANIPAEPTGSVFSMGTDPHTVTAYVSPGSNKAFGLVADGGPNFLAVIDLQGLLNARRSSAHRVDPTLDLVAAGIVRFVATAPVITKISPASGQQGQQNLSVTVSALASHFVQGTTSVNFGTGITVSSITVNSSTSLTAVLNIDPITSTGARNVTVTTGGETATLASGFSVTSGSAKTTQLNPASGQQGQQGLSVAITGQGTHFALGQTSANFGSGIAVTSLTVSSATSATAVLNIDPLTFTGGRGVTLTTGGESASGAVFTVNAGPATLAQLSPNSGQQGQTLNVTITGQSTHFTQGLTSANFGFGITVTTLKVNSATNATATLNIAATATLGTRTVTVTTNGEVVSLANGFTVNPATPVITQVNPKSGLQGQQNLSIAITGVATHFAQGTSVATFGAGITVGSLTVNSATSATAIVNISPTTTVGPRDVTITTGTEMATLTGGFTVNPGPAILTLVNPNSGAQGSQNLPVTITGQFTHFTSGVTTASLGAGVTVTSLTVNSTTSAMAVLQIDPAAAVGPRNLVVTTGGEIVSLTGGFAVTPGVPALSQISPNNGQQGQQNLSVAISGQFTHFVQGTSVASFGAGVNVASLTVNSATSATAVLNINLTAVVGPRNVTVTTGTENATLTNGFAVISNGAPMLTQLNPGSGLQGKANLTVTITGQNTHFLQGTTVASFGPEISVGGAPAGASGLVQVTSPTVATATISISSPAATGARTVFVQTGAEQVSLIGGFTVEGTPFLSAINPNSGSQGQTLTVAITGHFTNFQQGVSQANFGAGISVGGAAEGSFGPVTVTGPTTATAQIAIDAAAAPGLRTPITVQTGTETASLSNSGFLVLGPVTGGPPVVTITSPTEGSEITGATTVTGTVSSPNLSTWTLEYEASGSTVFTQFAAGTTASVSGTLDPSLLLNGIAQIRLTGVDQSGQSASTIVDVVVTRNVKIGNFTLSFNDLTIPVAGIPIQIIRTYDSRNKSVGDFGFGWSLSIKTTKVDVNGILGDNWTGTVSSGFFPTYCVQPAKNYVVSVRLQDGTVYQFQPSLSGACQQIVPPESVDMNFVPIGTTPPNAKLSAANSSGLFVSGPFPGSIQLLDLGSVTSFDPDQFTLTLPNGQQLQISRSAGIQSITDTNNNSLTFGPGGITSSTGKGVVFARDAQGRIGTITDPNGNVLNYAYNGNGDLATFTDQLNNVSSFTYDGAHDLLSFTDPSGVQPVRNVYDDSGRLIQVIDAFGHVMDFAHDTANNTETITDLLGNPTTYVYDSNGNVVSTTDALGNTTKATFDANGNKTSETNALGKTITFTYDANNNKLTETDPLGKSNNFTYNSLDQELTFTDKNGHAVTNTFDASGNLLTKTDPLGKATTLAYNPNGSLSSLTNASGNTTKFTYDRFGNIASQTDALGVVTTFTYDANGNRLSQSVTRTTPSGPQTLTTQYQYDALNRLVKTTFADGSSTQTTYNSIGLQDSTTDELGRKTTYQYDASGRLIQTNYPDGTQETSTYDAVGNLVQFMARSGVVTLNTYDKVGRLISSTNKSTGATTTTTYDAIGEVISTTDPLGNVTQSSYDADERKTSSTDALGKVTTYAYDAAGNQTSVTDANGNVTTYQYDAGNRKTRITFPDGKFETYAYDAQGQNSAITDAVGNTTQYTYDALGRLLSVTDALGQVTKYAYDEVGNRISQTDANNHTTTYQYDQRGRRVSRTLPLGQTETFAHDAAGNPTSHTDFNGKITTYTYDAVNRLLSKTPDPSFHAPAVTFTYTPSGKRATMTDAGGTSTYQYDNDDRLISVTKPNGTLTYAYDVADNLVSLSGGAQATYTYDALNRIASVTEPNTGKTTYTYDGVGNLTKVTYPNGVSHAYTYDQKNHLTNLAVNQAATPVASYAYTLDAAGHRTSVAELGGRTVGYGYDGLYRLASETISGASSNNGSIGYAYDAAGNRKSMTSTVGAIPAGLFNYDANDRLTTDIYDNDGSTLSSGGIINTYDFENRLVQHGAITMVYDGDGNRIAKTVGGVTTKYLVDDLNPTGLAQVVMGSASDGSSRAYVYGLERISQRSFSPASRTFATSFFDYDGHGSVRALSDSTGAVTDTYNYDAFGNLLDSTGSTANNYLYSGEQFDSDLQLYYNRARYLNVPTGRFLVQDYVDGDPFNPITANKYFYAGDDPVGQVDPSGLQFGGVGEIAVTESIDEDLEAAQTEASQALGQQAKKTLVCEVGKFVVEQGIQEGVYIFITEFAPGIFLPYVGQTGVLAARIAQHVRSGKLFGEVFYFIEVTGGVEARRIAEQKVINALTSEILPALTRHSVPDAERLIANLRNEFSPANYARICK
ncbi:MAG TPA: RHS repeat-associated core domain-containing protein [Terriglobales bacterium]|nr:RHS repeat-associated core domain-containing protein [Terriglobales bacterium]